MASIDLSSLQNVNFNGIEIENLALNGDVIWSSGVYSRGLEYEIVSDEAWVKGIGTCQDKQLVIPTTITIDGIAYNVAGTKYTAFMNNTNITDVTLSEGLREIQSNTFYGCTSLKNVTIPTTIEFIGMGAFENCSSMYSVNVPNLSKWFMIDFEGEHANPLEYSTVFIANGQIIIDLEVPEEINTIKNYAFYGSPIESVNFHDNVVDIGECSFQYCSLLEQVSLPKSLEWIRNKAFADCNALRTINFNADNCTSYGQGFFSMCGTEEYSDGTTVGTTIYIGSNVTTIPDNLFYPRAVSGDYLNIKNIYFLTDADGNSSCTFIGKYAFANITTMTELTLPNSLTNINSNGFNGVTLKTLTSLNPTPPVMGEENFVYNDNYIYKDEFLLFVPAESVEIYKTAQGWSKFADKIIPLANENEFNYVGLDANGNMEGMGQFDGTIVAYAIGKEPTYTHYKQVEPTPTTEEGYYGYYIYLGETNLIPMMQITSDNFATYSGQIIIGETPCYDTSTQEEATLSIEGTYEKCNAYNSEYYGGYDFQTSQSSISEFIVPEVLVLPNTYKGKPVRRILAGAFYGAYITEASTEEWQALNIKEIHFGNNTQVLDNESFYNLTNISQSLVLPSSMKKIKGSAFGGSGISSMQLEIPSSVEEVTGSVCYYWRGSKLIFGNPTIIKGNFDCNTSTTIVLRETVKTLTGDVFNGTYVPSVYVFEHLADAEITLDITSLKSAKSITIYTDNTIVKNYDWSGKNITVTFKTLSEYTG